MTHFVNYILQNIYLSVLAIEMRKRSVETGVCREGGAKRNSINYKTILYYAPLIRDKERNTVAAAAVVSVPKFPLYS